MKPQFHRNLYLFDGRLSQRIWARGIVTDYSYDGWGSLTNMVYSDGTPTVTLFYDAMGRQTNAVDAAGEGIDRLLAVKIGGESYYPLTDIQGTVWGYLDSSNDIVARWQYDAWGNFTDGEVSVPALAAIRYRFQCREWSAATGLTNFRMRWYDSVTGRWLSKDPIGLSGGLNLYAFCSNNPICRIDVYGTLSSAFWAPQEIGFGSQQVVTHFSASAQTSLKAGNWVMTGGNTFRNWLMAGGPEKVGVWGAAFTTTVTKATLQWPSGWEWVKGLMGQRIIR